MARFQTGLRALDEAIRFLEMGSGDRFGHATVLGLDLEEWYHRKDYCIHLKEQDYLDNVMWFYMMIMEFHLEGCELLKDYLYKEFLEAFWHNLKICCIQFSFYHSSSFTRIIYFNT